MFKNNLPQCDNLAHEAAKFCPEILQLSASNHTSIFDKTTENNVKIQFKEVYV